MASAIHVLLLIGTENERDSYNFIENKSYNIMSTDGEKQSTPVKRKTQFSFVCAIDNKLNDCFYSHFVIHYFLYTFYIADSALKSFISGGLGGESGSFPIIMSMDRIVVSINTLNCLSNLDSSPEYLFTIS